MTPHFANPPKTANKVPRWLSDAAKVAAEVQVTITIEKAGAIYRISPDVHGIPIGVTERDKEECDAAFGV